MAVGLVVWQGSHRYTSETVMDQGSAWVTVKVTVQVTYDSQAVE